MFNRNVIKYKKKSFSQCGEDLIIKFICDNLLQISKPRYLDIGAFHPYNLNNCQIFYDEGSHGINIEPNPVNFRLFEKYRKNDINLNFGIGLKNMYHPYYLMDSPDLNTFIQEEADKRESQIIGEIQLPIRTFNSIMEEYCDDKAPEIVSIDIEGLDEELIKSINFDKYKPLIFCVETINFIKDNSWAKNNGVKEFLMNKGYIHHSDTMINSIFVLESALTLSIH